MDWSIDKHDSSPLIGAGHSFCSIRNTVVEYCAGGMSTLQEVRECLHQSAADGAMIALGVASALVTTFVSAPCQRFL